MTRRGHDLESCWTAVGMNPSVLINASVARPYPTAKAAMAKPRESKLAPRRLEGPASLWEERKPARVADLMEIFKGHSMRERPRMGS